MEGEESKEKDNAITGSILGLSHGLEGLNKARPLKLTCSNFGPPMAMSIENVAIYPMGT